MTQMRTFIAINIKQELKFTKLYSALKKSLNDEAIRWVNPNDFHLTLRFLGNTSVEQINNICTGLKDIAQRIQSFQIELKGLGYFKSKGHPKVLYANIERSSELRELALEIDKLATLNGFEAERKEFKPHLTLGRIKFIKNRNNFYDLINNFKETEIQIVSTKEIIFYQSILNSDGAKYIPLKVIKLNA